MATHFATLDWAIIVVYVGATLAAGLYGRRFVGGTLRLLGRCSRRGDVGGRRRRRFYHLRPVTSHVLRRDAL